MDTVDPSGRFLGFAFHRARDDLRQPRILDVAAGGARAPRRAFAGLLTLTLLDLQFLFGVSHVALGGPLRLADRLLVFREVAAVEQHFTAMELGDAVHP